MPIRLHSVIYQKIGVIVVTAVRTSDLVRIDIQILVYQIRFLVPCRVNDIRSCQTQILLITSKRNQSDLLGRDLEVKVVNHAKLCRWKRNFGEYNLADVEYDYFAESYENGFLEPGDTGRHEATCSVQHSVAELTGTDGRTCSDLGTQASAQRQRY
jgi:hypothetical protein